MKFLRGILVDEEQFKEFVREFFIKEFLEGLDDGEFSLRDFEKWLKVGIVDFLKEEKADELVVFAEGNVYEIWDGNSFVDVLKKVYKVGRVEDILGRVESRRKGNLSRRLVERFEII